MNNKRRGTAFEKEVVELLASQGWWVHFISPDNTGAQPFDIIAVKDNMTIAIDCKTSSKKSFSIRRLEENQKFAFEKWLSCGNTIPLIFVKFEGKISIVPYTQLEKYKRVDLLKYRFERGYYGIYCGKQNTSSKRK